MGSAMMQGRNDEFPNNVFGLAQSRTGFGGAVILGQYEGLSEGDVCRCTGRILEVPVGDGLLGRVVDALGPPIDGKGEVDAAGTEPIEKIAPELSKGSRSASQFRQG